MRRAWAVGKREFKSYFHTPIGYVVIGMFAAIAGLGFTLQFLEYARISQAPSTFGHQGVPDFEEWLLSPFLVFCGVLIMFLSPLTTMRLLAEERHRGTVELLLTHPLRDRDIVFGKFGAALGMVVVMIGIVGINLLVISHFVPVEAAVLVFGILTVFLMGAAFTALGLFVSSITRNQVTAGTITFGLNLLLFIAGNLGESLPESYPLPDGWPQLFQGAFALLYTVFRGLLLELPVDAHAREMAQGIFQPQDIAYYVLFTTFFLFLTFRALESRNWRQ